MPKIALATLAFLFAAALVAPGASASSGQTTVATSDAADQILQKRQKPRVPGGSGCDDPEDIVEHPECQP